MTCDKCGNYFPVKIKIDGKISNLSNRRYCLECSPYKAHNTRPIVDFVVLKNCKTCNKPLKTLRRNYCQSCSVVKAQRKRKRKAVEYYGGKCIGCGYNKCVAVLHFDHRDPSTKIAEPNYAIMKWSWERAKVELDKCDLLCSNCHGERHWLR